jgi:integrase
MRPLPFACERQTCTYLALTADAFRSTLIERWESALRALVSSSLVESLVPRTRPYEIRDTRLSGFLVRVQPSGVISYYIEFERGRRMAIGPASRITASLARDRAKAILADAYKGNDPIAAKRRGKAQTFGSFIENVYAPWARANLRTASATVSRLKAVFAPFIKVKLGGITPWQVEKWRAERVKAGIKRSTINRDLADIKSSLAKAVAWDLLPNNPITGVKLLKLDPNAPVRYLTDDEEGRLRQALEKREGTIRAQRKRYNEWRAARRYPLYPSLEAVAFVDYLRPMVLLSLNTGLRQGEVFGLNWADVDFQQAAITIPGNRSKSGKTRYAPLNEEALSVLTSWRNSAETSEGLIFPSPEGQQFNNVRKSWLGVLAEAGITKFRWHDMRHSFASRLAMAGVDLNTIRELLGHADYKMTLRYAHLAPSHKAAAVAKLMRTSAPNTSVEARVSFERARAGNAVSPEPP